MPISQADIDWYEQHRLDVCRGCLPNRDYQQAVEDVNRANRIAAALDDGTYNEVERRVLAQTGGMVASQRAWCNCPDCHGNCGNLISQNIDVNVSGSGTCHHCPCGGKYKK